MEIKHNYFSDESEIMAELEAAGHQSVDLEFGAESNGPHWHDFDAVVYITDGELTVTDISGRRYKVYAPQDIDMIKTLRDKNVRIKAKPPAESPWYNILISWFPMLVLIGVWIFFMRQMQSGGGKALRCGRADAGAGAGHPGDFLFVGRHKFSSRYTFDPLGAGE